MLRQGEIEVLTFFSPRTARLFAEDATDWNLAAATAVSLSAAADASLAETAFLNRCVALRPTREGMLAALAAL